jgi:hypothetical protein
LLSDYTTSDNIHLLKGQHVQIVQRLNNEFCIVQLLSNNSNSSNETGTLATAAAAITPATSTPTGAAPLSGGQKQLIEVQVPLSIIKARIKTANFDGKFTEKT